MHEETLKIYQKEREKRLAENSNGLRQYLDSAATVATLNSSAEDPWVEAGTEVNRVVPNGGHIKYLVIGAGFSGILVAVRLLQQGIPLQEILVVDPAGGYGGTWYWNR